MKQLLAKIIVSGVIILTTASVDARETYRYDTAGRLASVTYDDNSTLFYSYDAMGNILGVTVSLNLGKGDVNGDGIIDMADAIAVLQSLVGNPGSLSPAAPYADTNGDGKIDLNEVLYILKNPPSVK